MKDHGLTEHMEALTKLADEDSNVEAGDPCSFLPSLYALRDERAKAKSRLSRRMKTALETLADDQPDNDYLGYTALFECLGYYRDFNNSAVALTLMGVPDLLTNALQFTIDEPFDEEGVDKAHFIELAEEISKNVVQAAKIAVPDSSQQDKRIEVAKEQVQSFLTEMDPDNNKAKTTAISLINSHITALQEMKPSPMERAVEQWPWGRFCDGPESLGTTCSIRCDFDNAFVHCLYCSNSDFCQDCFRKLRERSTRARKCGTEHAWIKVPRLGSDFWRGSNAKTIRVPVVRPVEGDENLWEACYDDETQEEVTVEAWKAGLAKEWEIILQT